MESFADIVHLTIVIQGQFLFTVWNEILTAKYINVYSEKQLMVCYNGSSSLKVIHERQLAADTYSFGCKLSIKKVGSICICICIGLQKKTES